MTIVETIEQYRERIKRRERKAQREMIRAYAVAFENIQTRLEKLTNEIEKAQKQGKDLSLAWLYQQERLERQLQMIERELSAFAKKAVVGITDAQNDAVGLGSESVKASFKNADIAASFTTINKTALESFIGSASDGSALSDLFKSLAVDTSFNIKDAFTNAIINGWNPHKLARTLNDKLNIPIARANTIARTEILRSYREASKETMKRNSDVVLEWQWYSTRNARTCPVCWAMDGKRFPLSVSLESHPNCRCVQLPVVDGETYPKSGASKFETLSVKDKREILGNTKYELYNSGAITLDDLVKESFNPRWGKQRTERPLRELRVGIRKAA